MSDYRGKSSGAGTKKTKRRRRKRRDEKNLYYIIERDLDREVLFPGNNGWESQVATKRNKNYKIDYVVNYGDKILGIDVKYDFPKRMDFKQVNEKYKGSLNAVYLAYPADRVGEALDIIYQGEGYQDFGLISLALFRSNCIRPATVIDNPSNNYLINGGNGKYYYFFNKTFKKELKNSGLEDFNEKEVELVEDVLDGDCRYFKLNSTQIKTLYYLIKLSDLYSPLKYFRLYGMDGFGGFIDKYDLNNLVETSLIYDISYGTSLWTFSPSEFSMNFRRKIANKVKNEDKKEIESALLQVKEKKKDDIKKNWSTYLC